MTASAAVRDASGLQRFLDAQEGIHSTALAELRAGRKRTHWMWFIFPQIAGLGTSSMAQRYALASLDEARAYLSHAVLGRRLQECCEAVLAVEGRSAGALLGSPDDLKLRSCLTLFAAAEPANKLFAHCLEKYFDGKGDMRTQALLAAAG